LVHFAPGEACSSWATVNGFPPNAQQCRLDIAVGEVKPVAQLIIVQQVAEQRNDAVQGLPLDLTDDVHLIFYPRL